MKYEVRQIIEDHQLIDKLLSEEMTRANSKVGIELIEATKMMINKSLVNTKLINK